MNKLVGLVRHVRHVLFHSATERLVVGDREFYLRCSHCGLRSPGIQVGDFRPSRALPGDPGRTWLNAVLERNHQPAQSAKILPWKSASK